MRNTQIEKDRTKRGSNKFRHNQIGSDMITPNQVGLEPSGGGGVTYIHDIYHYITSHHITLHYITVHCIALQCSAVKCIALRCITLH